MAADMADAPSICIIVVTRNCEELISETLDSLYSQEGADWRLVAIDGASSDGTCARFRHALRPQDTLISEPDRGIYDAMNRGIALTQPGEFCLFINAGDRLHGTQALRLAQAKLAENRADLHLFAWWTDEGLRLPSAESIYNLPACHQAIIYRSDLLREHPFDLRYRFCADFDQFLRLRAGGARVATHEEVALSYFNGDGLTSRNRGAVIREQYRVNVLRHGRLLASAWLLRRFARLSTALRG